MVIDGTGAPPIGPMDVIVEGNRIARIVSAGTPGLPLRPNRPPQADHEIDATGMFLLPGFINLHQHLGDAQEGADAEYVFKLWMAHGITTVRGVELATAGAGAAGKDSAARRTRSSRRASSTISGRALAWDEGAVDSPEKAREWVRWCAANGVDGMKLVAYPPDDHGGAARRGEEARPGIGGASRAEAASRR